MNQEQQNARLQRQADHIWHVWLNQRNVGGEFDHSMYEFKSMLDFLGYGARLLEKAFTGALPTVHQQCSHSEPVKIEQNQLCCAFGQDVTKCEILASLRTTFDLQRQRDVGVLGKYYADVPDGEVFRIMANTCAWHMYTEPIKTGQSIDTSEGWLMDASDRMFWQRTYESMAMTWPDPEDLEDAKSEQL